MNTQARITHIALLIVLAGATSLLGETTNKGTARTWTSRSGQTVVAEFVKMEQGMVHLKTADGKHMMISKAKLSLEDQKALGVLAPPAIPDLNPAEPAPPTKAPDILYDLFGSKLKNARRKSVSVDALSNKIIGVYFSAHWCPPCRTFTPILVDVYNKLQKSGAPFEIVFASADRDRNAMYQYMKEAEMPWLALPYGSRHTKSLSTKYHVRGIPKLVILRSSGEVITENGRREVTNDGASAFEKWQASNAE